MAYGLNWLSEFADIEEKVFRVEILKADFVGKPIEVISSGNPIEISWSDNASSNPFFPIRTQKAEIQWVSEEISGFDISDIFVIDQHEYKVRLKELSGDDFLIIWEGYLVPTDCKEPYQAKPYPVDMSASCSLALLKDQYFLDENGKFVEGVDSLMNIIFNCLSQTKLQLGVDVYIGLLEISEANPIMLSQTYIDTDGLRGKTCYDVLEGILNSVNAYLTQENGRWAIKGIRELVAETITKRSFNYDGSGFTVSTVSQVSTIGRNPMSDNVPNLFPTSRVDESIATPSSVITNTVSPGIAINKLTNGTFNPAKAPWGVNLGLMDGWAYSPEPKGYRVDGTGTPDDPYRFIMIGSVKTIGDIVYRTSGASQKNTFIYNTPVITIHRDGGKDSYPNIKIVVSGAFRARDGGRLLIACRINDGDKDWVQWLDENGTWTKAKKETDRSAIKVTVDTPHNPETFVALKDLPLQTFEVTSAKIPDYLDRPEGWIAKLYFSIYPITVGSDNFPEVSNNFSPAVWLEDIAVSVTTETAYEGEHYYQIESDTLIRNGEEYEYTSIVADKINILTAEQKRDENRVMTGYLTVGAFNIAKGWKRYVNGYATMGAHEPLQHLTLRERLRLLCGKRRILEGEFYGYGIKPTNAVINLFDGGTDSYHTITGYSWDVKNRIFNLRLHQLDFPVLDKEVITLKPDRKDNGRGNRMYQGASGSTGTGNGGNSGSDTGEQIVLDDPINYDYTVSTADETTRVCDVGILIQSGHAPDLLEAKIITYPDWITEISIYRGEDLPEGDIPEDGILEIKWKGKPSGVGHYQIVVELSTTDGADYLLVIPIRVFPKTVTTTTLLDKTSGAAVTVGPIPGLYFVTDISDISANIDGPHNKVVMTLKGGGPSGTSINETRTVNINYQVDNATYEMFYQEGGMALPVGQYVFTLESYFEDILRSSQDIGFVLYDEEYLAKLKMFLTKAGSELGEISLDGSSVFINPEICNIKDVIHDAEHDKVIIELKKDGSVIKTTTHTLTGSEMSGEYLLYDEDEALEADDYITTVTVSLAGTNIIFRTGAFEISKAEPKPEAGLTLGMFKPGTTNFVKIADLPLVGGEYDLPVNYTVLFEGFDSIPYSAVEWEFYKLRNGAFAPVNIETYTGYPQKIAYPEAVTGGDILVFRTKNSTQISDVHEAPETVRVVFTGRDENGEIVGIRQSDFSFRVPLAPEDQSGLRLITVAPGSGAIEVIDTNMPITGRKVTLVLPKWYSISARSFAGASFDHVKVKFSKVIAGVEVNLHMFGSDYVVLADASGVVTELPSDDIAYVIGNNVSGLRYLNNPSATPVLIDEPGKYKATFIPVLAGVEGTAKYTEFEVVESSIDETPVDECCGGSETFSATIGDGSSTSFTLTHAFGTKDVYVEIYEIATDEQVFTTVKHDTADTIIISFKRPPAVNSYRVIII